MFKKSKFLSIILVLTLLFSLFLTSCEFTLGGSDDEDEDDGKKTSSSVCDHDYSGWSTGVSPSCTSIGYDMRACSECESIEYQFYPATGHNWGELHFFDFEDGTASGYTVMCICESCRLSKVDTLKDDDDNDSDGLVNSVEFMYGSNPLKNDTDDDELSDYDEIYLHSTSPTSLDTDGDGASDKKEIELGFSPIYYDDSFSINYSPEVTPGEEDTVIPSVNVELDGEQLNSLTIERNDFFEETTMGYMGDAYKYDVEGEFDSAMINFKFDQSSLSSDSLPTIYSYDEYEGTLTPLETYVDGDNASTVVDSFSTYVLLDRKIYEESLKWVDKWEVGDGTYTSIEIVFVIDDSGSMRSNDPQNQRLPVVVDLIDKLPEESRIGIVKFGEYTTTLCTPTSDKALAKSYVNTSHFYSDESWTRMYSAMNTAINTFTSTDNDTMKLMVVLSDGQADDTSYHSSVINSAISAGINIYCVGLGSSSSSYFTSYMQPLAEQTGGAFYLSSNASELSGIYDNIGEKIDLQTDTDGDRLCDYYEDNMVVFDGIGYALDKANPDTDGDGVLDGDEIRTVVIFSVDGTQMTIVGKVYSDPTRTDSDYDGIDDPYDVRPLDPTVQ